MQSIDLDEEEWCELGASKSDQVESSTNELFREKIQEKEGYLRGRVAYVSLFV